LIFARVKNFIDAFSEAIENTQTRRYGTVDRTRNGGSFALPPNFLGVENIAVRDILKPALQKGEG
jgi:hypothetical protein